MRTDYALRALFFLAEKLDRVPVSIRELADRNNIPKRFLEQIMLEMKSKGWVASLPGKNGGYFLSRPPAQISLGEIVRHFDGLLAPIFCVSVSEYESCSEEKKCRFRRVLLNIRNHVAKEMDGSTLDSVLKETPVSRTEVFDQGFIGGAGI